MPRIMERPEVSAVIGFDKNLRKLRIDLNLTQEELAHKVGVNESLISIWESGKHTPSFYTLVALSWTLNVSLDDLVFKGARP